MTYLQSCFVVVFNENYPVKNLLVPFACIFCQRIQFFQIVRTLFTCHSELIHYLAGVRQLVVLINKMDDPTVNWSEERFQECRSKLEPFLKRLGFNLQRDVHFMPCSGYTGAFLRDSVPADVCPFYRGPTFFEFLGALPSIPRNVTGPVRLPILARFSEMGTCVVGKLERGTIAKNATLTLMPNRSVVQVGIGLNYASFNPFYAQVLINV